MSKSNLKVISKYFPHFTEGNTEGAKREQEGEHREDKKEETKIETTSVDQYNEDEKKLMEEIQDSQNGGGCFVEDEKGDGNGQEKQEGAQQEEDGSENKAIDDDKDTAKEDDSDYNNTTRTEHDDNDDKDSGIGNENKEDGTNSGRSSAKNSENSKSIRDLSVSDMNKANIRRGSEIPIATKDEYENLEEALERFNTVLLDQPIEGKHRDKIYSTDNTSYDAAFVCFVLNHRMIKGIV